MRTIRYSTAEKSSLSPALTVPELTIDDLPPKTTVRWVAARKAVVVQAVRQGLITIEEACDMYLLSAEEYHSWERAIDRDGLSALKVTYLKNYR